MSQKNLNKKVYYSNNVSWTLQKGSWLIHFILTGAFQLFYTRFFSVSKSYQLNVITYNISTFIFFHYLVGDPFDENYREFTFWEQLANQMESSSTLIFMSLYPVVVFFIVNRITTWSFSWYVIAWISLLMVIIPKLSFMHMKRLFKRYD